MATAARDVAAIRVEHLRGCPVAANPTDEQLAARVETYRTQKSGMRLNFDGHTLDTPWMTVAHCCECGAMTYHEEP